MRQWQPKEMTDTDIQQALHIWDDDKVRRGLELQEFKERTKDIKW